MQPLLSDLTRSRQLIAVDLQGHGRTADVDRPSRYEQMADDVAALLEHLGITQADVVGYSMGGGVGLQLAIRHPERVRKLVAMSAGYRLDGMYPEVIASIADITPEVFYNTPWYEANYAAVAPRPADFPVLVEKLKRLDAEEFDWSREIETIAAPTLLVFGDSDVLRPEHMVELFRLLGGGVPGDLTGLPKARLAVLPGTTHVTVMNRIDWLLPMITEFLDEPTPESN
jgi:pimeloyl-ACP methyl ester carboxylesterase